MNNKISPKTIAIMALFIALCYIGVLLNIPMSIGGSATMFHLGNTFCLLAALTLGGVKGGICGSLGMALYDATSSFQMYVPQTLILKFFIGLICGTVYKKLKIENQTARIAIACTSGMVFNIIFDPIASFITSNFLLGIQKDAATILAKWAAVTTFTNAIIAIVVATIIFRGIAPALKKIKI